MTLSFPHLPGRTVTVLTAVCLGTLLMAALLTALMFHQDRQGRLDALAAQAENRAVVLAQHVDNIIRQVDLALMAVAFEWESNRTPLPPTALLGTLAWQLPGGGCLSAFDPSGHLIDTNCRGDRYSGLTPQRLARHTGGQAITSLALAPRGTRVTVVRSVQAPDGTFLGLVQAGFEASALVGEERSLDDDRVRAVTRPDGTVLAGTYLGADRDTRLRLAIQTLNIAGSDTGIRVRRGSDFIIAGVQVQAEPLIALVAVSTGPTLLTWHRNVRFAALVAVGLLLGTLALLARLLGSERARIAAQAASERNRAVLERIVSNAPIGIWMAGTGGEHYLVNRTFAAWTGWESERPSITAAEIEGCVASDALAAARPDPLPVEELITFTDGRRHTLQVVKQRVVSPDGKLLGVVGVGLDITERKELENRLRALATTDALTGLANRHQFMEAAVAELGRARRNGRAPSLLMLDIDHFKRINDGYGHAAGDEVLRRMARVCRETLRQGDLMGRLGGEEFAILLPETDATIAREVAERLRQVIAGLAVDLDDGRRLRLTVSLGGTPCGVSTDTVDDALQRADTALYRAKSLGRNRVEMESCQPATACQATAL